MKKLMMIGCGCAALACGALEIAAWRGETVTAWVPQGEKIECGPSGMGSLSFSKKASAAKGVRVKTGVACNVKFVTKVGAFDYASVPDRVLWGRGALGSDAKRVVSVTVDADAQPGTYAFGDLKVRVVDRVLPPAKEWKYYLDLWQHPWAVARAAGVEPFSDAHYAKMEPLWKMLAAAGQKTLTVTLVDLPWNHQCYDGYRPMIETVRHADGTWTHDFKLFDSYVLFGRYCGLGPHIACYTMCPWGYKVSWLDEDGKMHKAEAKPGTEFFKEYWGSFLTDFAKHLKSRGWFKDTYISLDERSPEDLRNTVAFMNEKAPGLKIAMAGNRKPSEFKGISIDSYSQSLGHVNPDFLAEVPQRQKEGKVTTYYICCGPAKPNTFMDSELDEAFWCGFYPAACGLDGLLRWAYNSWPRDACKDASYGNWRSGDTFLVYPDGSPSMRFLALFNGIQQAEKFNILKRAGERTEELAALAAKYDLKAALNKKPGDFAALIRETKDLLNR
ncbi:MAG: DUF4091 domain-containing protein [Kiritimatiellae bacterium]|nr:DUF4091 domain-containing protein [Kiritimatiellia bacterium]